MATKRKNIRGFHSSSPARSEFEPVVQNNLSLTPAQMDNMRRQGLSISAQNLRLAESTDAADHDFYVPIQYRRGFDMVDAFNASRDVRERVREAVQKADSGEIETFKNQ